MKVPRGLLPVQFPKDNPYAKAKRDLGRTLYYDPRVSVDDSVSCASCHSPKSGFTDGQPVPASVKHQLGGRSAPTVINRAYSALQFWDGRALTLEEQAGGPMAKPHDSRFKTLDEVVDFYDKGGIGNKNLDEAIKPLQ